MRVTRRGHGVNPVSIGRLPFGHVIKNFVAFAGVDGRISLHSLRRYSLNKRAKTNLIVAPQIAGHKDTKTTLLYTRIDADYVRQVHDQTGVVRGIVTNRRYEQEKCKRLI